MSNLPGTVNDQTKALVLDPDGFWKQLEIKACFGMLQEVDTLADVPAGVSGTRPGATGGGGRAESGEKNVERFHTSRAVKKHSLARTKQPTGEPGWRCNTRTRSILWPTGRTGRSQSGTGWR